MTPNHGPNHNDNQIDRVLNALRDVPPPTGMDRRILNTLEAAAHHFPSHRLQDVAPLSLLQSLRPTGLLRWTPLAAAAVLTVIAFIALATRHHAQPAPVATAAPALSTSTAAPAQLATVTPALPIHHAIASAHARSAQSQSAEAAPPAEDAQISHPAPPVPLTDQERLLLRYARRGHTVDLAQISNDRSAAKEQQDAAEFQNFFEPLVFEPLIITGESE